MHTIMVVGGYGFFGRRVARGLCADRAIRLLVAGSDLGEAQALCAELPVYHRPWSNAIAGRFSRIDHIAIDIGSGGLTPGAATVRAVFGYCGKSIRRLENAEWTETFGWLDLMRYRFAEPVGPRLLGSCDVPDLELFPARYAPVKTVTFHAGFASAPGHLLVWSLSNLVKVGVLSSLLPWSAWLNRAGRWMEPWVSDKGAMFVELNGIDHDGQPAHSRWNLIAGSNHGPHIPCGASIALARKLAAGVAMPRGAMPCVGLLSVEEYLAPLNGLDIREVAA
jgi:hypothetical protein